MQSASRTAGRGAFRFGGLGDCRPSRGPELFEILTYRRVIRSLIGRTWQGPSVIFVTDRFVRASG